MPTLETLQARLELLYALQQNGAGRVTYEGRTVEYRSLAEINQTIADLEAQIAEIQAGGTITVQKVRHVRVWTTKGLV